MSHFVPPSVSKCSKIRSRTRTELPEAYSSIRSVKDITEQDYCDPHDPCCVNRDPEVFLHDSVLRKSVRTLCAPKNPLHFEYTILHRQKLTRIFQMAAERQQNEELTEEQLDEIKKLEEKEDASQRMQTQITKSRMINLATSLKPETEPSAPPKRITEDPNALKNHLQGLSHMALAHEIALNKDFKLRRVAELATSSPITNDPLTGQVQLAETAKDKYWAKVNHILLKKDLKSYKHVVIDVLSTMRSAVEGTVLSHNWAMREKIHQELNMSKIGKQIDGEAFDFGYYVDFLLDTLASLCCPVRDKDIVEIRDTPLISRQLRGILDLVETINLDMANFVLSQSRVHTMQNCIVYERTKFANYIEVQYRAKFDPLMVTRDWIRRHSIADRSFTEAMSLAFLEILEWEEDKEFPETLALDWHRFPGIREEITRVTVIGTIVTSVYEYTLTLIMGSDGEQNDFEKNQLCVLKNLRLLSRLREELDQVLTAEDLKNPALLQEALQYCGVRAADIVDEHVQVEQCHGIPEGEKLKIQQIVLPLSNLNHPMRQRYVDHVKEWFLDLVREEGKAKIHTPENLRCVGQLIIVPITEMVRLTMYNRGVFDVLYREIFDGRCNPPTVYPPTPEEENSDEQPVVLDANTYGQEDEDSFVMDENIYNILAKLRGVKSRTLVYRRSRIDPRTKPMFEADGSPIIPPERQPEYVPRQLTAIEQKHLDEYLLATEPTVERDYEGVYNFGNIGEPDWMFGYTTEQLLQIMERENLINANKLKRVKERMNQEILNQRVADNLPVFYKIWGKDIGSLAKEFCRLQRILEKGNMLMSADATDEASGKRKFPLSCQPPPPPPPELPKVNEKGETLIYASEGRKQFGVGVSPPSREADFDFEGIAKALADVKEVDPESLLINSSASKDEETALEKLLRNIPKPDAHWKMLDFRIKIPKEKTNRFKWSRMMLSMSNLYKKNPQQSPLAQFGHPSQRPTPNFTTSWAPPGKVTPSYTGARSGGFGGQGAPTSNQTVMHMKIPLLVGRTAIMTKAEKPEMPSTSDVAPANTGSLNLKQSGKTKSQRKVFGQTLARFPTVPMRRRQMVSFAPSKRKPPLTISDRQRLMMSQQEEKRSTFGNPKLGPPPATLSRKFSFDWRQQRN